MSNLSADEQSQAETISAEELRQHILVALEASKQEITALCDEQLGEIVGGISLGHAAFIGGCATCGAAIGALTGLATVGTGGVAHGATAGAAMGAAYGIKVVHSQPSREDPSPRWEMADYRYGRHGYSNNRIVYTRAR